jgi:ribose-phosphate pyrophosphokinase
MPIGANQVKLFSARATLGLAKAIALEYRQPLGNMQVNVFKDGEFQVSYDESVRGCDVFLIQSTNPPAENIMELCMMIDAAKRASANYITAVIPYFGYARQDRKDKPRVPITSKMIADMLTAVGANRVMTMDLHAPQIQGFFDIPVDHLDAQTIFSPYIRSLNLPNLIIASPDLGASNRNRQFATTLGTTMVICDKHRKVANEIDSMTLIGDVKGADVVLVDDMIDTGGTLCKAAEMLKEKGATSVRAVCTHPILSGKAYETIQNSALTELIVCDTIPVKNLTPKIRVLSTARLFADAIRNVHEYGSISSLFKVQEIFQQQML